MVIREPEARQKLKPYQRKMVEAVDVAFREWSDRYTDLRIDHSARTQSSLIHDLIIKHLDAVFQTTPEVRLIRSKGRWLVVINEKFVSSIKKLNSGRRSSNISTGQAEAFLQQLPLEGFPPATNIIIGYQYNATRTGWENIWITCPDGEGLVYAWPIAKANEPGNMLEMTVANEPQAPVAKRRIRRKGDHAAENAGDASDSSE